MRIGAGFGARAGKREVIDVAEMKKPDRRLDQLLHVHKQRLSRLERERNEARQAWREIRQQLSGKKQDWRQLQSRAQSEWMSARTAFFSMGLTNADFKRAKSVYERMKLEAGEMRLACLALARTCRQAGTAFFAARDRVQGANKQQEKLTVLRDEMKALALAQNAEA
ncbi:hypothetical protein [Herbaspirillum sp. SJZ099]|uniref:hypothetical protein n=1 Tax=Herbaspirillum sp. SJZ099 TaxID=2572916 RepID=UPI00119E757A|nr:hypothetical protein [Herbaspirillum sp. SJZ099]TWC67318.1 hypothetical protein FB597_104128 [Herbaspirillum sp. SJZ099]